MRSQIVNQASAFQFTSRKPIFYNQPLEEIETRCSIAGGAGDGI